MKTEKLEYVTTVKIYLKKDKAKQWEEILDKLWLWSKRVPAQVRFDTRF